MKTAIGVSIILLVLLPFRVSLQDQPFSVALATEVSGEVWGTWSPLGNPYNVVGEVRVPRDYTLVIEPGCYIDFQGHYKFIVDHSTLIAIGTETDSIFFTCDTLANPDRWGGIRFLFAKSASQLSYCRIENGKATGAFPEDYGGGVYTRYSSITITNNTVRNNSASAGGGICTRRYDTVIANNTITGNAAGEAGGIYCWATTGARVSNNIISSNSAEQGAGIGVSQSGDIVITDNIITDNSAIGYYGGGGIRYTSSGGLIANNIITGNSKVGVYGGAGIYCQCFSPTIITNNIIADNSCDSPYGGGGVYFTSCTVVPQLTNNTICGNSASRYGGGIYCEASDPAIANNAIYGNSANFGGGISCANYSRPTVTNTILWGNTAPYGPEIDTSYYGHSPVVTYSDVQGGWPGQGNIDADPIFVGSEREDFHLRWRSPCIDAGDPEFLDPDGTRSDIGAFYFNQDVPGIVELYPHNTPIVIPPEGGDIIYDGWVFNFLGHPGRVDIWTYAFVPEMGRYGPVDLYQNVRIPADSLGMNEIGQYVPGGAPGGDYTFVAYVGDYPTAIIDSSYFYFTKTGSIAGGLTDWFEGEKWFKEVNPEESDLPSAYALSQNYPNPFNSSTSIRYEVPVDGHVKLEVYNLFGQKVTTLVDSKQQAGYRSVLWDASELSSGLYFYKLTAGDFTETRRMMLVK
jgi:parallel beta-helix repeat protein